MKLNSHYVEKPWGRNDLPPVFAQADDRQIGEVWFDSQAEKLPLLVKWLFTSEKLSIQVHPNDAQAQVLGRASGKEECWFIVCAEPESRLGIGTLHPLTADELRNASLSGAIEDLMDWKPVKAGDYFYIPAGTVHAIGSGITLVEVQQNADITYRLYDYGRPRELHLDDGIAVSDAKPYADPQCGVVDDTALQKLVNGPHFHLWHAHSHAIGGLVGAHETTWVIPLEGSISVGADSADAGECLYVQKGQVVSAAPSTRALVAAIC